MKKKFIFITGGVLSSLGKGVTSASIAKLLELSGYKVCMMKLDPYLNVDPGTMSPFEHGEVYVTDDGSETDLDLGHYTRFSNTPLNKYSSLSAGRVYNNVITRERQGGYLGQTVQIIPHVTDEIKRQILLCGEQDKDTEFVIVEIGGTVGDIESRPFLEAIRQFRRDQENATLYIHLTYVPFIQTSDEYKTKPTQHSVQELQREGIMADILICRSKEDLSTEHRNKIALFCSLNQEHVLSLKDLASIYQAPKALENQKLTAIIAKLLHIQHKPCLLAPYNTILDKIHQRKKRVKIAIVGKYLEHSDAYKSIYEALFHASVYNMVILDLVKINSDAVQDEICIIKKMSGASAILVPGGFGSRGWAGMIEACKYAREKNIPYFGICLGLHVMCVEFSRNVLKLTHANSTEIDPITTAPVVDLMNTQKSTLNLGGSMRLGAYECDLKKDTLASKIYKKQKISERHRHRYELNFEYINALESKGLIVSGTSTKGGLCEIVELKNHPWMLSLQAHPEFTSKIDKPHPLFVSFVEAAIKNKGAL